MEFKNWPCWAKVASAIGLMIFVFNWPSSSGEWAAWVQAVGVIAAIIGSFFIGRMQSENALNTALKIEDKRNNGVEDGIGAIVRQVIDECRQVVLDINAAGIDEREFVCKWRDSRKPGIQGALKAFELMPIYLLRSFEKVELSFRVRDMAIEFIKEAELVAGSDDEAELVKRFGSIRSKSHELMRMSDSLLGEFEGVFPRLAPTSKPS